MPTRNEEEFELVLGNKQLLSLFFLVVLLFAIFFSFGYMVGSGGDDNGDSLAESNALAEEPEPSNDVLLPEALLKDTVETVPDEPVPAGGDQAPAGNNPPPAKRPRPFPAKETKAESSAPAPESTAAPAASQIHLQVAAMRVRSDAQALVQQLKAKGYRVSLYNKGGDGWHRVIVGPFDTRDSAKAQQQRLRSDGFDTILRGPSS